MTRLFVTAFIAACITLGASAPAAARNLPLPGPFPVIGHCIPTQCH